jgi:hypothetical protein
MKIILSLVLLIIPPAAKAQTDIDGLIQQPADVNCHITDTSGKALKISHDYQTTLDHFDKKQKQIVARYNADLSDHATDVLAEKWLRNDLTIQKAKRKCYRKLAKASSPSLASNYFLCERMHTTLPVRP